MGGGRGAGYVLLADTNLRNLNDVMHRSLAIDEAKNGVRVNICSPGNIWTPLWKSWSDGEKDPDAAKEAGDKVQVMQRKGTIVENGRLCLSIASELTFTTGVDHIISGGAELGYGVK